MKPWPPLLARPNSIELHRPLLSFLRPFSSFLQISASPFPLNLLRGFRFPTAMRTSPISNFCSSSASKVSTSPAIGLFESSENTFPLLESSARENWPNKGINLELQNSEEFCFYMEDLPLISRTGFKLHTSSTQGSARGLYLPLSILLKWRYVLEDQVCKPLAVSLG
ncbi:uncharacterized protein LOC21400513 isoform X1 [Morus notabilis]|uniref:uncharacterized protein LOC21400513 isoform X1 n=1 Tax=Morus notabilis TaxID=981085 RepID=UPI000CED7B2C|nr:uncharacterized protein LOC21400513 isoform X1 [Morus notabilis]